MVSEAFQVYTRTKYRSGLKSRGKRKVTGSHGRNKEPKRGSTSSKHVQRRTSATRYASPHSSVNSIQKFRKSRKQGDGKQRLIKTGDQSKTVFSQNKIV